MLGLNFTHADAGFMQKLVLDPKIMKTWGIGLWAIFIFFVLLGIGLVWRIGTAYHELGILKYYLVWATIFFSVFFCINKKKQAQGLELHIHHYVIAMALLSILCYQSVFLSAIQGITQGVMLEGGARWGYDPIWIKPKPPKPWPWSPVNLHARTHSSSSERREWCLQLAAWDQARMHNYVAASPAAE